MSFLEYVKKRIKDNKNFLSVITGQTGSGKSYSALKFGEALDPDFCIDRVAFNPLEFMRIIQHGRLKSGSVIVFDEAGVGISAQEWQSIQNKLINYVLQTFRHKNYIVLFTTPHFSFISASNRKLFHAHMETVGIDHKRSLCRVKPLLLQINQRKGDTYYKYLRIKTDRGLIPLKRINFPLPSKELVKAYEDKKTTYTKQLNKDILAELEAKMSDKKPLTAKQQTVVDHLKEGLSVDAIAAALSVNPTTVYRHIDAIKNKGYSVTPVKNGSEVEYYEVQ